MPACRDAGNAAMPGRWLPRSAESLQRAEPLEAARNGTQAWEGTNYRRCTPSVRGWTWAPTSCKLMSDLEPALFFARRQPVVLVDDSLTRDMFNSIVDSVNMHPDYECGLRHVSILKAVGSLARCRGCSGAGNGSECPPLVYLRSDFLCGHCEMELGAPLWQAHSSTRKNIELAQLDGTVTSVLGNSGGRVILLSTLDRSKAYLVRRILSMGVRRILSIAVRIYSTVSSTAV